MSLPETANLLTTFSISPYGGDCIELADLNGDGTPEILILQHAGQFCSQLYSNQNDLDDTDQALFCLTAVALDGSLLWQHGIPYMRDYPFTAHGVQGGGLLLRVADLDGDGHLEVIVVRHGHLVVLDSTTGTEKISTQLPSDNFVCGELIQVENEFRILCKVNDRAYSPWDYANPIVLYNSDLSIFKDVFSVPGAGHNMVIRDIDRDGRDEFFIGYSLLDADGNTRWSIDLGPSYDYASEHADHIAVSDLDNNGNLLVRYAGSRDFFVTDLEGSVLWSYSAGHSQRSAEGPWGPRGEKRILMSEKNMGLCALDRRGNFLWKRSDLNGYATETVRWTRDKKEWCIFRPQLKPITPTPFWSNPTWSSDLWPRFLDSDGNLIDVFPWSEDYIQPKRWIRASRSYDCGIKYYPLVSDLDNDGLDEVLIYDRDRIWIFHSPEK